MQTEQHIDSELYSPNKTVQLIRSADSLARSLILALHRQRETSHTALRPLCNCGLTFGRVDFIPSRWHGRSLSHASLDSAVSTHILVR